MNSILFTINSSILAFLLLRFAYLSKFCYLQQCHFKYVTCRQCVAACKQHVIGYGSFVLYQSICTHILACDINPFVFIMISDIYIHWWLILAIIELLLLLYMLSILYCFFPICVLCLSKFYLTILFSPIPGWLFSWQSWEFINEWVLSISTINSYL